MKKFKILKQNPATQVWVNDSEGIVIEYDSIEVALSVAELYTRSSQNGSIYSVIPFDSPPPKSVE